MKRSFKVGRNNSFLASLIFGTLFSFGMLLISTLILSGIFMALDTPTDSIEIKSLASLLISGAISAFVSAKFKGEGGTLCAIFISLITVFIMLIISLIASRGGVDGAIFMNYLCYLLISALFAYLGKKRERTRRHKK